MGLSRVEVCRGVSGEPNQRQRAKRVEGLFNRAIIVTEHRLKLEKEVSG